MDPITTLASTLAKLGAPILGGALGGPAGATLATSIVGALADALGTTRTPEAVQKELQTNPKAASIVQQVDIVQGPTVIEDLNAILADRQDARATTVKLVEQGSAIAWGAPAISVLVMLGFGVLSYLAIYGSPTQREVILFLLGAWSSLATGVVQYWTGSSANSRSKDSTIANLAKR